MRYTIRTSNVGLAASLLLGGCLERLNSEFYVVASTSAGDSTSTSGAGEASSSSSYSSEGSSSTGTSEGTGSTSTSESSGTSTTDTSAASSTGTEPVVCGDGVVGEGEECDDANDDDLDDCDNACARSWIVFVASGLEYTGAINGLVGADTRCRNKAGNGGLPRYLSYRALISDSTTDARDRLHHARGWYRLVNGLPVAHGFMALMNDPLENPINVTETSETLNYGVWTGTMTGGVAIPDAQHCNDWKSESAFDYGHWGWSDEVDATWLSAPNPNTNPGICGDFQTIYCVEQP